jgi:Fe-S-cluster containining protein
MLLAVEGKTGAFERCLHQVKGRGCSIHGRRPSACRAFRCEWLLGRSGAKPDQIGLVFVRHPDRLAVVAHETSPGTGRTDAGMDALANMARQCSTTGWGLILASMKQAGDGFAQERAVLKSPSLLR